MINSQDPMPMAAAATKRDGRPRLRALILPFWKTRESLSAWVLLMLLIVLMFGAAPIYVYSNQLAGRVVDGLVNRHWEDLGRALTLSVALGVFAGILLYIQTAVTQVIELKWRTWLTADLLKRWFGAQAFAEIERDDLLSNSDQRVAEDAKLFVDRTLNLSTSLITVAVTTVTYTSLLWTLSQTLRFEFAGVQFAVQGYMVYVAVAYCAISLAITHWVGRQMIGLSMHRQGVEADFRFRAMQVRENAEQIALYRGSDREYATLRERFEAVRSNFKAIVVRQMKIGLVSTTYSRFFEPLPTVAALPLYFSGQITMGGMASLTGAYHGLAGTLSFFSQAYVGFAEWLAVANRVRDLMAAIEKATGRTRGFSVLTVQGDTLSASGLVLKCPMGRVLTHVPEFAVKPGDRLLIQGPSGTGKSTLLRSLAGLWPYGEGKIHLPSCGAMFVPQRSYIATGSVKEALAYPKAPDEFSDQACRAVLVACGLEVRLPSLTEVDQWQQVLSGGEQQRIALARVLLHKPRFVFLDEATSALDPLNEEVIYGHLTSTLKGSAIVSIAHRESLHQFHERTLELQPA